MDLIKRLWVIKYFEQFSDHNNVDLQIMYDCYFAKYFSNSLGCKSMVFRYFKEGIKDLLADGIIKMDTKIFQYRIKILTNTWKK